MAVVKEKDLWGLSAYCVLFHDSVNLRFGSSDVMLEGLSQSPFRPRWGFSVHEHLLGQRQSCYSIPLQP